MKPLIYLASPYSSDDSDLIQTRVSQVNYVTAKLIEQGNLIFSPIVHSHPICEQVHFSPINTAEAMTGWTQYDHDFIDHCQEVWVLMLDGWDRSRGVSDEIAYAYTHNIPVRFVSFPDIKVSARTHTAFTDPAFSSTRLGAVMPREIDELGYDECIIPEQPQGSHIRTNGLLDTSVSVEMSFDEAEKLLKAIFGNDSELFPETESDTCPDMRPGGMFWTPGSTGQPPLPKAITLDEAIRNVSLPDDADERNRYPMAEGLLYYFPNALADVSKVSLIGAEQHLPGQPMHWARGKSTDHANKIIRHLIDAGKKDANGNRHSAFAAWRALALLQEEIEQDLNLPLPKNARAWDGVNE